MARKTCRDCGRPTVNSHRCAIHANASKFNRGGYDYRAAQKASEPSTSWWLDAEQFYQKLHASEADRMARTNQPVYLKPGVE